MGAIQIVDRLHRLLGQLDVTDADADTAWILEVVRLWRTGTPWDEALGLGGAWRAVLQQRDQQRALAALQAALPAKTARGRARRLKAMLGRYENTGWRKDQWVGRPEGLDGYAWDYLGAAGPTSFERLRKLVG